MGYNYGCNDIIAVWSFGQDGNCFHENIGFRVGDNGYKQIIFEVGKMIKFGVTPHVFKVHFCTNFK